MKTYQIEILVKAKGSQVREVLDQYLKMTKEAAP